MGVGFYGICLIVAQNGGVEGQRLTFLVQKGLVHHNCVVLMSGVEVNVRRFFCEVGVDRGLADVMTFPRWHDAPAELDLLGASDIDPRALIVNQGMLDALDRWLEGD